MNAPILKLYKKGAQEFNALNENNPALTAREQMNLKISNVNLDENEIVFNETVDQLT